MPVVELGVSEWLTIITHVKKWVTNLLRAKSERKKQSKEALRAVIKAVRETTIYLRILREEGQKSTAAFNELFLNRADIRLSEIEQLASASYSYLSVRTGSVSAALIA